MPTIFMAGFAIISSVAVLILPETLNIKLADTIKDSINLDKNKEIRCSKSDKTSRRIRDVLG